MTQGPVTFTWRGCRISGSDSSVDRLPMDIWRGSAAAVVSAEHGEEMPPALRSNLLQVPGLEAQEHFMPRLVDLRALSTEQTGGVLEWIDRMLAERQHPGVEMFLEAPIDFDRLLVHLRTRQLIERRGERGWLRWHDPHVWVHLLRVMQPDQLKTLFGPVDRWHLLLAGQWWSVQIDASESGSTTAAWPDLTSEQWDALLRLGPVNRALAQLGWTSLRAVIEHSAHMDAHVQRAGIRHGLVRQTDLARYAVLAAPLRLDFDEHSSLAQVMVRNRSGAARDDDDANLMDELEATPEDVWQEIATTHARRPVGLETTGMQP